MKLTQQVLFAPLQLQLAQPSEPSLLSRIDFACFREFLPKIKLCEGHSH